MLLIPLQTAPDQTVNVMLGNQQCTIDVQQRPTGLFASVYVADQLIIGGVLCLHGVKIVREAYRGFIGELVFYDTKGVDDPVASELGDRFVLAYVE